MFTETERIRAIELYFKYGRMATMVVHELGYQTERNLRCRVRLWEKNGGNLESLRRKPRYSAEQKQRAVEHYLGTGAAWHLPAEPSIIPRVMYWLAGLMNFTPTDGLFSPVRLIRMRLLILS